MVRPATVLWAVGVHLLIGVSGLAAGLPLVAGLLGGGLDRFQPTQRDLLIAGLIAFGIVAYGVLTVVGAIGVWRGSRVQWWIVLVVDLAGLAVLLYALSLSGVEDALLIGGVVLWLVAIGLLVAPQTRATLRR